MGELYKHPYQPPEPGDANPSGFFSLAPWRAMRRRGNFSTGHTARREKRQFWVRDGQGPCIHLQCSALKPSSGPIVSASGHLNSCRVSFGECGCMFNNSQTSGGIGGHQDCTRQFRNETVSLKFGNPKGNSSQTAYRWVSIESNCSICNLLSKRLYIYIYIYNLTYIEHIYTL